MWLPYSDPSLLSHTILHEPLAVMLKERTRYQAFNATWKDIITLWTAWTDLFVFVRFAALPPWPVRDASSRPTPDGSNTEPATLKCPSKTLISRVPWHLFCRYTCFLVMAPTQKKQNCIASFVLHVVVTWRHVTVIHFDGVYCACSFLCPRSFSCFRLL